MSYYVLLTLDLSLALFPAVTGMIRFKRSGTAVKIFVYLMALSFFTDCVAFYAALKYRNNMPVYNIANLVQICLIALYFNYSVTILRRYHLGFYIAAVCVLAGILDLIYLEPLNTYNSNFFLVQTLTVISLGALLYRQCILDTSQKLILNSIHFWLVTVLVFFYAVNFLNMSLYDYYTRTLKEHKSFIDRAIVYFNLLTNAGFGIIFLLFPQKCRNNV